MGRAFEFRKARKMKRWSAMAKTFTRIGKDIAMSVRDGGPNPETNSRLRAVIQNAKAANMPKDNIERAIKRASDKSTENYKEVLFEGYAPHGIAILVETATDNNNRTVANIRSYFNKCNGTLGTNGSLDFIFDRKGVFTIEKKKINMDLEDFEMELIDSGLEDLERDNDKINIYCDFKDFNSMQVKIESLNIEVESSELHRIPSSVKKIKTEQAIFVLKLLDLLEENDDVQQVFHNMELTEDILNLMEKE